MFAPHGRHGPLDILRGRTEQPARDQFQWKGRASDLNGFGRLRCHDVRRMRVLSECSSAARTLRGDSSLFALW
jgi:hypothetical protein